MKKELGRYFQILCTQNHTTWVEQLKFIENCINNTCNETTGYSPTELFLRKEPEHIWTKFIKNPPNYNL